jgi:hypothetical protein
MPQRNKFLKPTLWPVQMVLLVKQARPKLVRIIHPRFITPVTLAQTMAAFFELSLLRLCPPLPNNVTGQNGQL